MNNNIIKELLKVITEAQLDNLVGAIIDGKYSWSCVLFLKYVGLNASDFIPSGTYYRLRKENRKIESKPSTLEMKYYKDNQSRQSYHAFGNKIEAALEQGEKLTTSKSRTKISGSPGKKDKVIKVVYQCKCDKCKYSNDLKTRNLHAQTNLFLSRLNEEQRRLYVALEAKRIGYGGIKIMSEITGMHSDTIRRGAKELENWGVSRN